MKLIWKGKYTDENQLSIGNLPKNAVKFKGADTQNKLLTSSYFFMFFVIILIAIVTEIKISSSTRTSISGFFNVFGVILSIIAIVPHELLHGIAMPKNAEVQFWYAPKKLMAFTYSTCPIKKYRFIYLCLLPSFVLGFIPFMVWIFTPLNSSEASKILFTYSTFSILAGCGDYYYAYRAITQMPKNTFAQYSQYKLYWYYMKE